MLTPLQVACCTSLFHPFPSYLSPPSTWPPQRDLHRCRWGHCNAPSPVHRWLSSGSFAHQTKAYHGIPASKVHRWRLTFWTPKNMRVWNMSFPFQTGGFYWLFRLLIFQGVYYPMVICFHLKKPLKYPNITPTYQTSNAKSSWGWYHPLCRYVKIYIHIFNIAPKNQPTHLPEGFFVEDRVPLGFRWFKVDLKNQLWSSMNPWRPLTPSTNDDRYQWTK